MSGFEKILVGVDLHQGDRVAARKPSLESTAAIEEAIHLAAHSGASITFCSCLNISAQAASLIEKDHANLLRTVEDIAAEMLDTIVETTRSRGLTADKMVRIGSAHEELSKVADEGKYDLIVVGTRPRSRASRMLFGSTSQKLIRFAPCAVWVVKPETVREVREVAVATDLSETGRPALIAAIDVARALGAKLYVVHAVETSELAYLMMAGIETEEIVAAKKRMLDGAEVTLQQQLAASDYRTLPHGVKVEIIEGAPDEAIPKFVSELGIDILVMGTHGRSGLSRLVLGNTAERILPSLDCSVITVRPTEAVSPVTNS